MPGPEQRKIEKEARRQAALTHLRRDRELKEKAKEKSGSSSPKTSANTNKGNMSTKESKIAVYNDPVDSSSSKRKANDHADAPAPKKANTNTLVPRVPRAPGERYQGTAARPPPESRPALKEKPVKKARDIDPMDVDIRSSLEKSKTWQQSDVSSSSGRKRNAEHDLNKSAAKKQRSNGLPPSNLLLTQSPQAGKAGPNRVICVKPTPKNNFFNSLYPKNSKIKASPGHALVSTEYTPTAVQKTAVRASISHLPTPPKASKKDGRDPAMKSAPAIKTSLNKESGKLPTPAATPRPGNSPKETIASGKRISKETLEALIDNESASAEQTARTAPMTNCDGNVTNNGLKRPSVKVSGQTPLVSNQGHNAPRKGNEKPSKRKRGTASEEEPEHNKRRKDDRSTVHVEEHAQGAKNHCLKEKHKPDDPNANHGKPASRGAKPRGLRNEKDACYINAVLQAIANIPMMADHYRSLADKVLPEVAEWVARNSKKWDSQAEEVLKVLLEKNKSEIYLGAYLGALLNEMLDPNPSAAETPSSYVFRQACGVLLMSDMKQRYDGETQRDCMEYLEKLLDHLDWEELDGRIENFEAPSLIKCLQCRRVRDSGVEQKFAFTTSMPAQKNSNTSVCITECLDTYSDPDIVEVDCNDCGIKKKASKWMQLTDLSPYVFVNISRVVHEIKNKKSTYTKNPYTISLPASEVVTFKDVAAAEDVRYEAIGTLKHAGIDLNFGHWTSSMKIDGQWWYFDDAEVAQKPIRGTYPPLTSMVVLKRKSA